MNSTTCSRLRRPGRESLAVLIAAALVSPSILAVSAPASGTQQSAEQRQGNGQDERPDLYRIALKSRVFTPDPGIELSALDHFQTQLEKRNKVHAFVQLATVPSSQERQALEAAGLRLLSYVGGNAWFAALSGAEPLDFMGGPATARHPALSLIRWMGKINAGDKTTATLRARQIGDWARSADGEVLLVLSYHPDVNLEDLVARLASLDAKVLGIVPEVQNMVISVDEKSLSDLAEEDGVRWLEPVPPPPQPESNRIRTHLQVNTVQAAPYNLTGEGVKVGIFEDNHAYPYHPDFGSRLVKGDTNATSYFRHTTAMAGFIGGNGTYSTAGGGSSLQYRGMATNVTMVTYMWSTNNFYLDYTEDLRKSIAEHAIDLGNNSWGNPFGCDTYAYGTYVWLCGPLDAAVRGSFGRPVNLVFSAGNERQGVWVTDHYDTHCISETIAPYRNYDTLNHPKSAKNTLVIGAIDTANNRMSSYSNWGPTDDGRIKPELVASGHHDGPLNAGISEPNDTTQLFKTCYYPMADAYYWYNGMTSGAAAAASGCIALLLQDYRNLLSTVSNPLPSTVKALLIHSARDLNDSTSWYNPGPDYSSGYGLLQLRDAIDLMRRRTFLEGELTGSETADVYSFWTEPGQTEVKATLVWDDPPAVENASITLVNDLDLVLIDPNGRRYYPWTLDPANPSADAIRTTADRRNNVEQVLVDAALAGGQIPSGTWTLRVEQSLLPQPPQRYSLVTSHQVVFGGPDAGFNPNPNSVIYGTAVQPDGRIVLVGRFTSLGVTPRNYIARVNDDGTLDPDFNPNANGTVYGAAVQTNGQILVGGAFTTMGTTTRNYIARLNSNGSLDTSFTPRPNGTVYSVLVQPNGRILLGGQFTLMGTTSCSYLARVHPDGSLDTTFNPNPNFVVLSVALQPDGKILLGGGFVKVGGITRNFIARVNPDGSLDNSFNPNANDSVFAVATQADGKILLGGYFTSVGGTPRSRVARVEASGALDPDFNPNAFSSVYSIAVQADGKILLGGSFTRMSGIARNYIARVHADGTLDAGFDSNASYGLNSVALQADGQILIGGGFTSVGGMARTNLARLLNGPAEQTLTVPEPSRVEWLRAGTTPEVELVTFELSVNGGSSWTMLGGGTRISGGWAGTALSLPPSGMIRARGRATAGYYNGSSGLIEQVTSYTLPGIAPQIAAQPTNQTVVAGQRAGFIVAATGTAPLSYQWRFNGTNLPGATATEYVIASAQTANEGGYCAVVTNAFGNVTSIVATLTVIPPGSPQLSVSPTMLEPLSFRGRVTGGETFEVWNRGGGSMNYSIDESIPWLDCLPANGASTGEHDPITVNYAIAGLAVGIYSRTITVTAAGAGGSPQTIDVYLAVLSRPRVIRAYIQRANTLTIEWTGGPGVWLEKSLQPIGPVWTPMPGSEGISQMELPMTDSAAFFRVAASAQPNGSITQQPASLAVAQGSPAAFAVSASGTPTPSYQWRLNGANIFGANNSSYAVGSAQPSHVGEYTVVVSFGSLSVTSSPATLVILAPYGHLAWIPKGTFVMGSPDSEADRGTNEGPQTTVTLSRGFWMGTYEVTQQEYTNVMGSNPSHFTTSVDLPVEFLGWTDATNYCSMLTQRERASGRIPGNYAYRLPTEAEWEYACRAATPTRFSYGDDPGYASLAAYAWYLDNSGDTTHPVGGNLPNPWGLYDMYGNVWEWCQDWLATYPGGSVTDPVVGPPTGSNPIVRGGSYYFGGAFCRSAKRGAMDPPTGMRWDVGLRVVLARTGP